MPDDKVVDEVVDDKVVDDKVVDDKKTDAEVIEKSLIDVDIDKDDESDESDDDKKLADDKNDDSVELKMPEGLGIDDEKLDHGLFNKLLPMFQEANITQEALNGIVSSYAEHVEEAAKAHGDKMIEKYQDIKNEWKNDTQKALGNEIKQNLVFVGNALKQFGSPELVELMNETGTGDHIEVIKAWAKVGKHFSEDSFVDGKSTTEGKAEDVLYPSMNK